MLDRRVGCRNARELRKRTKNPAAAASAQDMLLTIQYTRTNSRSYARVEPFGTSVYTYIYILHIMFGCASVCRGPARGWALFMFATLLASGCAGWVRTCVRFYARETRAWAVLFCASRRMVCSSIDSSISRSMTISVRVQGLFLVGISRRFTSSFANATRRTRKRALCVVN